jgi:hypothetical protein
MPHKHAFEDNRLPGIYCSGIKDGMPCQKMLAADTGGLFVVRRDQMVLVVERIHSIRCPVCGSNNIVPQTYPHSALLVPHDERNSAIAS